MSKDTDPQHSEASPQHTPGPWRFDDVTGEILSDAPVADGDRSLEVGYAGYLIAESVARCNGPVLAAAPDLLADLEVAVKLLDALDEANEFRPQIRRMRTTILSARSEGRQP